MKRFTTGADSQDPGFGPVAQLAGHLAALPMLRVGLYLSWDLSPVPGSGTRTFTEGGLHVKLTPPLLPAPWKLYAFAGFGGAYVHAGAFTASEPWTDGKEHPTPFSSMNGGLLEVPVGVGLARKLGGPWEAFVELGARFGVGFFGNLYDSEGGATATIPSAPTGFAPYTGIDSFALSLSAGVSLSD